MFKFHITNAEQDFTFELFDGKVFAGRAPTGAGKTLFIKDPSVSRTQFSFEAGNGTMFLLTNISSVNNINFDDGGTLTPGASAEFISPNHFTFGATKVSVLHQGQDSSSSNPESDKPTISSSPFIQQEKATLFSEPTIKLELPTNVRLIDLSEKSFTSDTPIPSSLINRIIKVLENINKLQNKSIVGDSYNNQIAEQLVHIAELDIGMVLLLKNDKWIISGCHTTNSNISAKFSSTLVRNVLEHKKTFFQDLSSLEEKGQSLLNLEAAVVSPIEDLQGNIVGALYGARSKNIIAKNGISNLEAQLVQMLATTVSGGIAKEQAIRSKTQFEQFFSSELVRELDRNPNLLAGREQEITVMFSDLRGFTSLSNKLKPADICLLLQDIMENLSEQIQITGGVIVDYAGDGILAMWNAPLEQPDHAERACKTAWSMLEVFPIVCKKWAHLLGDFPLGLGIGVNTGNALVGNTGSKRKFKYGPMGLTVNLASRLEASTKVLGLPFAVSASTKAKLPASYIARRLGLAIFPGIPDPVQIFECPGLEVGQEWLENKKLYELALQYFEEKAFGNSIKTLTPYLEKHKQGKVMDTATLKLVRKALEYLETNGKDFSQVIWTMTK